MNHTEYYNELYHANNPKEPSYKENSVNDLSDNRKDNKTMLDRLEQIKSEYRQQSEERAMHKIQELNQQLEWINNPELNVYTTSQDIREYHNGIAILRDYINSLVSRDVIYHLQTKGY